MFAQQATGTSILCVGYSFSLQTESLKRMLHATWDHGLRRRMLSGIEYCNEVAEDRIHGGLFGELYQNVSECIRLYQNISECIRMYLRFSFYFVTLFCFVPSMSHSSNTNDLHLILLPSSSGFEKRIDCNILLKTFVSALFSQT